MQKYYRLRKINIEAHLFKGRTRRLPIFIAKKILSCVYSMRYLNNSMNKVCSKFSFDDSDYVSFVFHENNIFKQELFGVPKEDFTLGFRVLTPEQSELYLSEYYGEWKRYFPFQQRYHEYERLYKELEKNDNLDLLIEAYQKYEQ